MNKSRIIVIVILAAIAMIALVGLQVHWVQNAMEIRNDSFEDSVEDAMRSVVKKVEKRDISQRLKNRFQSVDNLSELLATMDSLNDLASIKSDSSISYQPGYSSSLHGSQQLSQGNMLSYDNNRNREELLRLLENSTLLSSMFMDMMGLKHMEPLKTRLDEKYLDSILRSELQNKDVETPYIYGVLKSPYQKFTFTSDDNYTEELRKTPYSYDLFPNDIFREPVYLNVHFPKKSAFILSKMTLMLVLAIILISLLIFSFYYIIQTIFRQKKLSEMKNDFINNMTHEFKTPISTISLACQTLTDDDVPKNTQLYESYIHVIEEENNRLGSMAEKILQTAIIDKGSMELNPDVINMHDVVNNAIEKIRMQVEQKDGEIFTNLEATNPVVKADKFHMTNLVFNLLDNANKYSFQKPAITVRTKNKANGLQLEITDNGIGISKANQKKIFEKLYRVPTGNIHEVKGFGLGLSYVKAILDKHNGEINIQSEINKGSTFSIFIPFQINETS